MSSNWRSSRRPSAPDTTEPPAPRPRTTSGSMAMFASVFGLGPKAKSREKLRTGTNSAPAIARSVGSTPPALITANLTPKSSSSSRIPRSTNRQTVVSTGSSDIWPEPTTPSSASDTKRSFQSMGPGLGAVGDDPFARAPVYVTSDRKKEKEKERPPERVRKLGVSAGSDPLNEFPHPPRTPVISEPGPSRQLPSPRLSPSHLSPATLSPTSPGSHLSPQSSLPHLHISRKSSSSRLSPQSSSSHLSPQSSTSRLSPKSSFSHISSDSNLCPGSPSSSTPTTYTGSTLTTASPTSVIAIGSVSALDMHAHAHATQSYAYSPESSSLDELYTGKTLKAIKSAERLKAMSMDRIDDDDVLDPEIPGVAPSLGIRRGQSAHAVLSSRGAGVNMGSMLGIASGIVGGGPVEAFERAGAQSPVGPKKVPPKRPSRSELRERKSSPSLARHIVPPERHDSLRPVPSASSLLPPGSNGSSSFLPRSNGSSSFLPGSNGSSSFLPGSNGSSSFLPRSPGSSTLHPGSAGSRRGSGNDEGLLAVPAVSEHEVLPAVLPGSAAASSSNESTPVLGGSESRSNRSSPRASASNGSPHISSSNGSPHISTSNGSPHMSTSNGSPHISTSNGSTPNASAVSTPNASAPLRSPSLPRTRDVTPTPASPSKHSRLAVPRPQSPTPRSGEVADLNNYAFAPMGHEAENASINLTDLGIDYTDGESVLSDDDRLAVTFHHDDQRSKFAIARQRPPPSPTTLPFMAGNAGRRPRGRDMVYPSGVHIIPTAALRELAKMGKEEDSARDAVVGRPVMEMEEEQADTPAALEEEQFPTPSASSPSPVNTLTRISSMSSRASSCSSVGPEAVPRTVSSHVAFSRHTRTGSYSDSELDWDLANEKRIKAKAATKTGITSSVQTAVAWRCGSGNHEKCCQTRALRDGLNMGRWKCCAERAAGKNARCCAAFVGRPCERPRVSSTSSASVHEAGWALKRQRSFHLSSFSGMASPLTSTSPQAGGLHANARRFFHRPHTSHGKSTSSALLDEETKAMISAKGPRMSKEDPGPQSTPDDLFSIPSVSSPPMSPLSRHEFKAQYIISPAQLRDHLKEARTPTIAPPAPPSEPGLRSPRMEPARQRSNTTTTNMTVTTSTTDTTGSVRSTFSSRSTDSQPPMRSLNPPRRNHNASLPVMTSSQPVPTTRRYVQSISSVTQPARPTAPPPPPRSPVGGLPPPPRGRANNTQPIVSFISPRTASGMSLRHQASLESCASASTVRRERPIPQRENQMSFLEFEVEEEGSEEEEEDESNWTNVDMAEQPIQSFLDLGRQSGDTMRESMAMFS